MCQIFHTIRSLISETDILSILYRSNISETYIGIYKDAPLEVFQYVYIYLRTPTEICTAKNTKKNVLK